MLEWRVAPAKAAKISPGELSQYRSMASLNGGGRPFAIARAIFLAYSSVGEDFGWARLIVDLNESKDDSGDPRRSLGKISEIHIRTDMRISAAPESARATAENKLA
jgi:hypothetical protein